MKTATPDCECEKDISPYAVFFDGCDANGFRDVGSGPAVDMNPKRFDAAIAAYAAQPFSVGSP